MLDAVLGARASSWRRVKRYARDPARAARARRSSLSTLLARLPIGINALAIVLYLREQTGSFAIAGAVAGALAAGVGRRRAGAGPARRPVRPAARARSRSRSCTPRALGAIVVLCTELGAPAVVLLVCGFAAGFAIPPTSSVLRSMWPTLLRRPPRPAPGARTRSTRSLIELIFITGPLLDGGDRRADVARRPRWSSRRRVRADRHGAVHRAAAVPRVRSPSASAPAGRSARSSRRGVRTLVLSRCRPASGSGCCEVGLPAFAHARAPPERAGLLLAVWSLGSAARRAALRRAAEPAPLQGAHLAVAGLLPLGLLPLAAAPSVAVMALLVIPAGCCIAPLLATRNELSAASRRRSARTEAYTWPVTAFVGGIAIGRPLAGALVEGPGWRYAFLVGAAFAAAGALIAVTRRASVTVAAR